MESTQVTLFLGILELVTAVIVAYMGVLTNKQKKDNEDYRKHREEIDKKHTEEKYLSMQMQDATAELSYVISLAVTGGHTNGNVERAQKKVLKAQADYAEFLRREFASDFSKE